MLLIGFMFDVSTGRINVSLKLSNMCNLCVIGLCIVNPSKLYPNVSTNVADEERVL